MKTILWKEFREHAFWVPLALSLTCFTTGNAFCKQQLFLNQMSFASECVFVGAIVATFFWSIAKLG